MPGVLHEKGVQPNLCVLLLIDVTDMPLKTYDVKSHYVLN
jgi:hypothetical protein